MVQDAIGAHARDELGISEALRARPIQAALASAGSFAVGTVMPLLVTTVASPARVIPLVAGTSLVFLALLGGLAARAGGAGVMVGALRVTFWGALAMAVTAGAVWNRQNSLFYPHPHSPANGPSAKRKAEYRVLLSRGC
jgi:VIT1/CCC1 family predicted Fe2+/Mn2+ transporter